MANPFDVELNTTDPGQARAFHTALFDWKLQDMTAHRPDRRHARVVEAEGLIA